MEKRGTFPALTVSMSGNGCVEVEVGCHPVKPQFLIPPHSSSPCTISSQLCPANVHRERGDLARSHPHNTHCFNVLVQSITVSWRISLNSRGGSSTPNPLPFPNPQTQHFTFHSWTMTVIPSCIHQTPSGNVCHF